MVRPDQSLPCKLHGFHVSNLREDHNRRVERLYGASVLWRTHDAVRQRYW